MLRPLTMIRRALMLAALLGALAVTVAPSIDAATRRGGNLPAYWHFVHFHLNAYAHWGRCDSGSNPNDQPSWRHYAVNCHGQAELGQFGHVTILNHSSKAFFWWVKPGLTVGGVQRNGWRWWIEGETPHDFNWFRVDDSLIEGRHWATGTDPTKRGDAGGPLAVNLSSHTYDEPFKPGRVGFSLNLQGYVHPK